MERLDDIVHALRAVLRDTERGRLPTDVKPFALTSLRFVTELIARLEDGRFHDPGFVRLLALDADRRYIGAIYDSTKRPGPWKVAFDVAAREQGYVLRNLLLGINAHVSYDLVVTLSKFLAKPLRPSQREDFFSINDVIRVAVDGVQNLLVTKPGLFAADFFLGRLDERVTWMAFRWMRAQAFDDAMRLMNGEIDSAHVERKATVAAKLIAKLPH